MKPRLNQKGQALVEYTLLLVLAVAILVALTSTLFQPMKKWTDYYMGTYTTCLLDYGVLPGNFGGTVTQCQQQAINSGMAGSAANNAANAANQNAEQAAQRKAAAAAALRSEQQRANSAAKRNSRASNSYSNGGDKLDMSTGRGTNEADIGSTGRGNVSYEKLGKGRTTAASKRSVETKVNYRGVSGMTEEQIQKLLHPGEATAVKTDSDALEAKAKRIPFKPPPPKVDTTGMEEGDKFSVGNFFRLIIMALIIMAVIYVVGTQVNSITKSMDG